MKEPIKRPKWRYFTCPSWGTLVVRVYKESDRYFCYNNTLRKWNDGGDRTINQLKKCYKNILEIKETKKIVKTGRL